MARLMIYELPGVPGNWKGDEERRTLRHWLTLEDGRIFYQDEALRWNGVDEWLSVRGAWEQLPTPPALPRVVGLIDYGGMPLAMRSDGECFTVGRAISAEDGPGDAWVRLMDPVPLCD